MDIIGGYLYDNIDMATAPDAPRPKLILCWIINCFLWSPKFAGVQFANFIHFKCIHSDSVGFWSFQNTLFTNTTNWTEHHDPEHLMNPFTFLISNFKPNTWKPCPQYLNVAWLISKYHGWQDLCYFHLWTFHCCLCLSGRSKTHYWITKVRIEAESWTECIYNIYTSDTGGSG